VLRAQVEGRAGRTLYARWVAPFGLWPLWGAALAVIAMTMWMQRRRRPSVR
jgi:apolipoprotein N-acyltransferase